MGAGSRAAASGLPLVQCESLTVWSAEVRARPDPRGRSAAFKDPPSGERDLRLVEVEGPTMGLMDNWEGMETKLGCQSGYPVARVYIVRSSEYKGFQANSLLWQPILRLTVELPQGAIKARVGTEWHLRDDKGKELTVDLHEPSQKFPLRRVLVVRAK
ncbi:hypothetical protein [Phenylobacterium sp.]|uniref:hypothetical protein n=1 Tax=Phenylobacterium sp. TaxID=1871053 RepID=UPI0025D0FB67|nr:hypothetical protein [Phenylobacterium sp.]